MQTNGTMYNTMWYIGQRRCTT